jgi:hypothetical protein
LTYIHTVVTLEIGYDFLRISAGPDFGESRTGTSALQVTVLVACWQRFIAP